MKYHVRQNSQADSMRELMDDYMGSYDSNSSRNLLSGEGQFSQLVELPTVYEDSQVR